jgi:hypothetical protein
MAAGDASITGLGSALRSDREAGLPTETGSGLLRRKVPLRTGEPHGAGQYVPHHATPRAVPQALRLPRRLAPYATIGLINGELRSD